MSQFLNNDSQYSRYNRDGEIDFDDAVKLPEGGSTCDIYRTRWQRRDVFVKRLKEQYRTNPIYLDALDKEFDIGVKLRHPSLPIYHEFHRDYIVLDYTDGLTLAEMIKRQDPWLKSEKNIVKMLKELVDVVGYLHRHNIVHCDIKPDNIMITANGRNLVLIDFDKSYTDSLGDTSGHPGKYGLPIDEKGCMAIDFHGMAMVVEKLKSNIPGFKFSNYKKFVKACFAADANCDDLLEILSQPTNSNYNKGIVKTILVIGGLIAVIILITFLGKKPSGDSDNVESAKDTHMEEIRKTEPNDSIIPESTYIEEKTVITTPTNQQIPSPTKRVPRTEAEIHAEAKEMAAELDKRIKPYFSGLMEGLDRLKELKDDSTYSAQQLLDSIRVILEPEESCIATAYGVLEDMYPGLTPRERARIMSYSKVYTGYTRRARPEGRAYRIEYERRAKIEGVTVK
ncbi:MAG: protein kinase [Muribaculaceae bacterium]|nr:protein kinase [Muribaculaceae bacterium]